MKKNTGGKLGNEQPDGLGFESEFSDKELGMGHKISRRDFLDGVALTIGAAALAGPMAASAMKPAAGSGSSRSAPPFRTGMRGTYDAAKTYNDQLIAGTLNVHGARETDEHYDLVVVGAGISALSAAYFYRRDVDPNAKILLIDPHDDFGGHAKRNEFLINDVDDPSVKHRRISIGGSFSADHVVANQGDWRAYGFGAARDMLDEIGMNYVGQSGSTPQYPWPTGGKSRALWLKEVWNTPSDVFQLGLSSTQQIMQSPMAEIAKKQRLALDTAGNWLADVPPEERAELFRQHKVGTLLTQLGPSRIPGFEGQPLHPDVFKLLYASGSGLFGLGYPIAPMYEVVHGNPLPGFPLSMSAGFETIPGANYPAQPLPGVSKTAVLRWNSVGGTVTWVGGNSMVARKLVANLIPDALPASTDEEFITTTPDYTQLDQRRNNVRIRLNSTVVRAEHGRDKHGHGHGHGRGHDKHSHGRGHSRDVEVVYADHESGKLYKVRAKHLYFGCWNAMIPFIAPELPQPKKDALAQAVKFPMEYTRVGLTNYRAFMEAGVTSTSMPGGYYQSMGISRGGAYGDPANPYYQDSAGPDKPVMMSLSKGSHTSGINPDGTLAAGNTQDAARAGQARLVGQSFQSMERRIRDHLTRCMQGTSFDPARDIGAITVNRWQQGYMRWYQLPNDASFWKDFGADLLPKGSTPADVGAAPWGRMTVGTTDAGNHGFFETSIQVAYNAVQYLKTTD